MNLDAYAEPMETLCEVIRKHGGELHQSEFDCEFSIRNNPTPTICFAHDTPIVGTHSGLGTHCGVVAWWLDLIQHMAAEGMIVSEGQPPDLSYRISEPARSTP